MILNKRKLDIKKSNGLKNRTVINKNNIENDNLSTTLKQEKIKYDIKPDSQIKDLNENKKNFLPFDEYKKNEMKQYKKEKINKYLNKFKSIMNNEKTSDLLEQQPESGPITNRDSYKIELINANNINKNKTLISLKKYYASNNYLNHFKDRFYYNVSEKRIFKDKKNSKDIDYTKIIYNKSKNKIRDNNDKKNFLTETNSISSNNKNIENNDILRNKNISYKDNKHNFVKRNISEIQNNIYIITKKKKRRIPLQYSKKPLTLLENFNEIRNKTINSFYVHKKNSAYSVTEEIQEKNKNRAKILSDFVEDQNYLNQYNNTDELNRNNSQTFNNNKNQDLKTQIIRKKNNIIKILDNGGIKEFNINFNTEENIIGKNYLSGLNIKKDDRMNDIIIKKNKSNRNNSKIEEYNQFYIKTLPPININQFNINANSTNNSLHNFSENINKFNDSKYNSSLNYNYLTQRNTFNKNNNIIPRDDLYNEIGNKKVQSSKLSNYGESPKNYDNNTLDNNNNKNLKTIIKKRPINEMRINNMSYKKFQNLKFQLNKEKGKDINLKKENNQNKTLESNINKKNNYNFKICPSEKISFIINSKRTNVSNNNNEISNIDNKIKSKINNIKENIIFIKKNNKKILKEIYIEENINKINQELKKENFTIENKPIIIIPLSNYNNLINKEILLNEENNKLKKENKLLIKKDKMKEELIQKLDKEKQKLIEEIKKLNNKKNN